MLCLAAREDGGSVESPQSVRSVSAIYASIASRGGLDVLVHPNRGDQVADHTSQALWLGNKLDINTELLFALSCLRG